MGEYPKRRKHKDNPYRLLYNDAENKYYVLFKDTKGISKKVEITKDIYQAFNQFELDDLSELNEYDNHIEHNEVYEETLFKRSAFKEEPLDDYVIKKSSYEDLISAIKKLPSIQRQRIKKYYFDEKTMQDIAEEEHCSKVAIKYSLKCAINNLKKNLKN